jgi:hypothetical protein
MKKNKGIIHIQRTEQWEYTACLDGMKGTGSSEQGAELRLLRKIVFGDTEHQPLLVDYLGNPMRKTA